MHLKLSLSLQLNIFTRSAEQTDRQCEQMLLVGSGIGDKFLFVDFSVQYHPLNLCAGQQQQQALGDF